MADATPTTPLTISLTGVDIMEMRILPLASLIFYILRLSWSDGTTTLKERTLLTSQFGAALSSFTQATPKKKFLTYLVNEGIETNLTVT